MRDRRLYGSLSLAAFIVATAIAAPGAGCAADREDGATVATASALAAAPALAACTTSTGVHSWQNHGFPDQASGFEIELDATPSANQLDAVVGISDGPAGSFPHLAIAVRFNTDGLLDVRSAFSYVANVIYPWSAGTSYHFRIRVDMVRREYEVWVRPTSGGGEVSLAHVLFRSEQRDVPVLGNVAAVIDRSADPSASLQVCASEPVFAAPFGCFGAAAGQGFVNVPLPRADVLDTVTFEVTASEPDLDAVIALTAGPASQFSDLAAAFRFAPGGKLDARDGDSYRADIDVAYGTKTIDVRIFADVTTHRFSVFEGDYRPEFSIATGDRLGRNYQFRPSQADVTALANLALAVDGDHGNIVLCKLSAVPSRGVFYSRDGRRRVFPFPDGSALLGDGVTTTRVDPAGHELASVALAGSLAADPTGKTYIARLADTALTIDRLDAGLQQETTTVLQVPASSVLGPLAVDARGGLRFAVLTSTSAGRTTTVSRLAVDGTVTAELTVPGFVVLDGEETFAINNTSVFQICAASSSRPCLSRRSPRFR